MTEYPVTWGGFTKIAPTLMERAVIEVLANNPMLGVLPLQRWPGGPSLAVPMRVSEPTIASINESSTMEATRSTYANFHVYPSMYGGDIGVPLNAQAQGMSLVDLIAAELDGQAMAFGKKLQTEVVTGGYMTEANVTIKTGQWNGGTDGVDAVVAVSQRMSVGEGALKYTHSGTYLAFRAPGSSTYGTNVSIAGGDGNYTVADGEDATKWVTLTIDASDFTGGAVNDDCADQLTFQRPEAIAGIYELAQLDTTVQGVTVSTNGDAFTLAMLDELDDLVIGPPEEKVFFVSKRTLRSIKALLAAAGGLRVIEWMDGTMRKSALEYEGKRIIPVDGIAINETQGTCSTATRAYCARLSPQAGLFLYWVPMGSANAALGTRGLVDRSSVSGDVELPVYVRSLGEMETKPIEKWRATGMFALCLKSTQSLAMRYGITT